MVSSKMQAIETEFIVSAAKVQGLRSHGEGFKGLRGKGSRHCDTLKLLLGLREVQAFVRRRTQCSSSGLVTVGVVLTIGFFRGIWVLRNYSCSQGLES